MADSVHFGGQKVPLSREVLLAAKNGKKSLVFGSMPQTYNDSRIIGSIRSPHITASAANLIAQQASLVVSDLSHSLMSAKFLLEHCIKRSGEFLAENCRKTFTNIGMAKSEQSVLELPIYKKLGDLAETRFRAIFKDYDIRGAVLENNDNVPVTLTPEVTEYIGKALGSMEFNTHNGIEALRPGDTVVVGRDNGMTSGGLSEGLVRGLRSAGINVIDLGEGTSGEIYQMVQYFGAQGGIMITRSHVENHYNGLKIVLGRTTLFGKEIKSIADTILKGEFRSVGDESQWGTHITELSDIARLIMSSTYRLSYKGKVGQSGFKYAVNYSGATSRLFHSVIKDIFGESLVAEFRTESDPLSKLGTADCSKPKNLENDSFKLISWSKEHPDVVVFSYDLDADRVSVLIAGELYTGVAMHLPAIEWYLERNPGEIVLCDPRASRVMQEQVLRYGGKVQQQAIGHSKVKKSIDIILRNKAAAHLNKAPEAITTEDIINYVQETDTEIVQAEESLHFFITNRWGIAVDDAIAYMFRHAQVLEELSSKYDVKLNLAAYLELKRDHLKEMKEYFSPPEARTKFDDLLKKRLALAVMEYFRWRYQGNENVTIADIEDGFRLDSPIGFVMYRYSNTEPKVTIKTEGDNAQTWRVIAEEIFGVHWAMVREFARNNHLPDFCTDFSEADNPDIVKAYGANPKTIPPKDISEALAGNPKIQEYIDGTI